MKKKKFLVFGATGFIGSNFINKIRDHKVYNIETSKKNKFIKFIFEDEIKRINYWKNQKIDYLINFAWSGIPDFNKNNLKKNLISQKQIINFAKKINVKKVFIAGSCFEYDHFKSVINEKSKLTKTNSLGITKKKIYDYAKKKLKNKLIWGRIFYVYGSNQRKGSLLQYVKNLIIKKKIPKIEHPFHYLDYIDVRDVVNAIYLLCLKNKSGIYNICTSRPIFNYQIIKKKLNYNINLDKSSNKKILGFIGDNSKLLKIGWSLKFT